jgi:hypothetical protein
MFNLDRVQTGRFSYPETALSMERKNVTGLGGLISGAGPTRS